MDRFVFPLTAIALLVCMAPVGAAVGPDDAREDTRWRDTPRVLSLQESAHELLFISEREVGAGDDRLEVRFDLEDALLSYRFAARTPDAQPVEFSFDVEFVALVEFQAGPDGRFDLDSQVVDRHPIPRLQADRLDTASIHRDGYRAVAEYTVPGFREGPLGETSLRDGSLRLEFIMVGSALDVGGDALSPTALAFNMVVEDYPFSEPGSRLGLEIRVSPDREASLGVGDEGFVFQQREFLSVLGWEPTAHVDGARSDVAATVLGHPQAEGPSQGFRLIAAYPQGDQVEHDWSLQTKRFSLDDLAELFTRGNVLVFLLALLGVLAVAGWPVLRRLRE